ncbi:hypothetical protein BX600DRAFT_475932 [Xylariales sp. PMI_506]|nr:hypothetical protein BX600DRAFT_475932 [Xylariales sp. PMI_506]
MFDGQTTSEEVITAFPPQIKGRTFVITGAGQPSIGSEMALSLAKGSPAHILIASRTASNVHPVLESIAEVDSSIKTTFVQVDLADRGSVRQAAAAILSAAPKIDVLINSAGVMATKEYTVDKHGVEIQLSTNHIGHFLLTNLLAPALIAAAAEGKGARVVNLTSSGYLASPFRFDDWNFSSGATYDPWTGYAQSKTANVLFTLGLGKRLQARGVTSAAPHPGFNHDTRLGSHLTPEDFAPIPEITRRNTGRDWVWEVPASKTLTQIAATPLIAALDPEILPSLPAYLCNGQVQEVADYARAEENIEKLWKLSEEIVGEKFEY